MFSFHLYDLLNNLWMFGLDKMLEIEVLGVLAGSDFPFKPLEGTVEWQRHNLQTQMV